MAHVQLSKLDLILAVNDMGGNEILVGLLPYLAIIVYYREGNPSSGSRCGIEEPKVFQENNSEDSTSHEHTFMWSF